MWMPTHLQVTVQRAEGLLIKGKNNTNDSFVTIALGKTKYRTSIREKAGSQVEWHEECELPIPDQGNTAEIVLTVLHQNFLGVDEFLGRVSIPLRDLDIYERPKNKWYTLQSKPGKEKKDKDRGRLEAKIVFTVKSGTSGSLTDLAAKDKNKLSVSSQISNAVGGSLMSLRSAEKRKGLKKFAKSIGSKMNLKGKKKSGVSEEDDTSSFNSSVSSLQIRGNANMKFVSGQIGEDADPGVVSEDDDEFTFDELSHKSSAGSVNQTNTRIASVPTIKTSIEDVNVPSSPIPKVNVIPPPKPPRDEWESKLVGNKKKNTLRPKSIENLNRHSWDFSAFDSHIEDVLNVSDNKHDAVSLKSEITPELPKKPDGMFSKFKHFMKEKNEDISEQDKPIPAERIIIGKENKRNMQQGNISNELLQKFEGKSREDLILTICDIQGDLDKHKKKLRDLEDYLDDLLLRVMETQPRILQNPYVNCKLEHRKMSEY